MNSIIRCIVPVVLLALSGCIIVADGDDWEHDDNDWRKDQRFNRTAIADLTLGSSVAEVRDILGQPDISEAVTQLGRDFLVLRYRTQHRSSDGDTTSDETTPLVFENGRLVGWGDVALRSIPGIDG